MQAGASRTELPSLLVGLMVHVPGETLNDKTGLLASIFGIAGFILSVGIVVVRVVTQRGKRCPATLMDLDRLGAWIVAPLQDRIVDQLASREVVVEAGQRRGSAGALRYRDRRRARGAMSCVPAIHRALQFFTRGTRERHRPSPFAGQRRGAL